MQPEAARPRWIKPVYGALALIALSVTSVHAEIDGHGPDAWRVTGVRPDDRLNARMGPGVRYPVIETFAHDERGLKLVTCAPYYTLAHYQAMTETERKALPERWCLVRDASLAKAGWVAQRFITPDGASPASEIGEQGDAAGSGSAATPPTADEAAEEARRMVEDLYVRQAQADRGAGPAPLEGAAGDYFTADIAGLLRAGSLGAHPLYGAQDFEGRVTRIAPDEELPALRGMVPIRVDFTNSGQPQKAVLYLRPDTTAPGAPLRIFRVEHDGWAYP